VFGGYLERGIINQTEYDDVMAKQLTPANIPFQYAKMPALEREIAQSIGNPVLAPMLERLKFLNEQAWNDGAQLIFGQVDRSNVQRFFNHPLLYWPLSYQVKAVKWLAGLMFDRFMGVDSGSIGALVLDRLHQQHVMAFNEDEGYREFFRDNETQLFIAQMLFPITPFDIGVGLSPFTRLAMESDYARNIASVGPGYTIFNLIPRLGYSLRKGGGPLAPVGEAIGKAFPFTVTVRPSSSQQTQAQQQLYGDAELPPAEPFFRPPSRYQESGTP
jgi:hypothetical protein